MFPKANPLFSNSDRNKYKQKIVELMTSTTNQKVTPREPNQVSRQFDSRVI
jgi:hypothetical protein